MLVILTPVKNRAWILPDFLQALRALRVPTDTHVLFWDDASTDGSRALLHAFAATTPRVTVLENDVPYDGNTSSRDVRNRPKLYARLATVRNMLLDHALALGADAILSVDSDILVAPSLLDALAAHETSYCSALICNDHTVTPEELQRPEWTCATNLMTGGPKHFTHVRPVPLGTVVRATLSGAVMLLRGDALQARFAAHHLGEDAGHAKSLAALDVPVYCHTTPVAVHCFRPVDLSLARRSHAALCG